MSISVIKTGGNDSGSKTLFFKKKLELKILGGQKKAVGLSGVWKGDLERKNVADKR